ncbi:MAG: glycoside hydrolase family 2 protein [Candidatus Limnocylindria bacterium]
MRDDNATIALDGEWSFVADPERLYAADDLPPGAPITVPGCWEAQVPRPYRIINAWYRRSFEPPADWDGSRLLIHFGAVMYRCAVWLNGVRIGEHEGGYTAFALECGGAVRWGAANQLVVEVQNPLNAIADYPALAVERIVSVEEYAPGLPLSEAPHGKQTWYSSQSGLWQSVRAERVGTCHIDAVVVFPDVAGTRARARWRVLGDRAGARLELRVVGPDGDEVGTAEEDLSDAAGETVVPVPDPVLWGIGAPNLYRLEARVVLANGVQQDALTTRFGMREVGVRDGAVTLNGEAVYLLGVLDQDLYPETISTPPSRAYLDEQLRRARELGFNILRCHIKVPDPMYLDAADEAGLLVWCELPNWTRFSQASAERGVRTLDRMVETLGSHPSVVIWTIINEDWGTQLRHERRDRQWLSQTYSWLKALDPTRLVVDNSACETREQPNFHLKSDLADFHIYFGPDNAVRWRNRIEEFAGRPAWLWSPHGDAEPDGDEPLILSEFGGWGLPTLAALRSESGREPWWFGTGHGYYRPSGIGGRFERYGLDRIWPDLDALAEATQWSQFHNLQEQIGELRRHATITGYVVTELSDAYWEANGLLDAHRRPKVFHERLGEINATEVVWALPERRDLWGGAELRAPLFVSSYAGQAAGGGAVDWRLKLAGGAEVSGSVPLAAWPAHGVSTLPDLLVSVPAVEGPTDATLELVARDGSGGERARNALQFAILPDPRGAGHVARKVAIHDPLGIWELADRMTALGHEIVPQAEAELTLTSVLTPEIVAHAESGGRVLALVRTTSALPKDLDLRRRVSVHLRRFAHAGWPGQVSPWEGDWVSSFSWILPDAFPRLPRRAPLDQAYGEIAPDHVLLGYDPVKHRDEVPSGMFVGWVHAPAALIWEFRQGDGVITVTTLRLAPESGPVATTMLDCLIQQSVEQAPGATRSLAW